MIVLHWKDYSVGCLILLFVLIYSAYSAYHENRNRKPDDPEKKDFHPLSPWLTPATPFIWLGRFIILAPWSIPFGIFLLLFPFMLILLRPVPPNNPIKRFVLKLGNFVLKINTRLLHALGFQSPQPIKLLSSE